MKWVLTFLLATAVTGLVYLWLPALWALVQRQYGRLRDKCDEAYGEQFESWPTWRRSCFYLCGPLLSLVISICLFRDLRYLIPSIVVLALLSFNLSVPIAHFLKKRRINQMKTQLPDALSLISNALRAGLSLQQGFQMAAEELDAPLAGELRRMMSQQQLGKSFNESLDELHERIPLDDVELVVSSLQTLRETGGNLIETMEIILHTIREEQRIRGKIKTLTTQGVAQAVIICALPFFLGGAIYVVSPDYIEPFWTHWIGWGFIAAMLLFQGTGVWIMRKILDIKV